MFQRDYWRMNVRQVPQPSEEKILFGCYVNFILLSLPTCQLLFGASDEALLLGAPVCPLDLEDVSGMCPLPPVLLCSVLACSTIARDIQLEELSATVLVSTKYRPSLKEVEILHQ
jgi:hypothetical protein